MEELGADGDPVYITLHGEPKAVLVDYHQYEALIERLEDLSALVEIYETQQEPSRPMEEFMAELEAENRVPDIAQAPG